MINFVFKVFILSDRAIENNIASSNNELSTIYGKLL